MLIELCRRISSARVSCTYVGNGEPLNEPGLNASGAGLAVRGTTLIRLDPSSSKVAEGHAASLDSAMSMQLVAAPLDSPPPVWLQQPGRRSSFSGIAAGAVPLQLSVMTAQSLGPASLLVRVQHLYEAGEDPILSGACEPTPGECRCGTRGAGG